MEHDDDKKVALTADTCRWAYRLFLGREPESEAVVDDKLSRLHSLAELRQEFFDSAEIKRSVNRPVLTGFEPALEIEHEPTPSDLRTLFDHVQQAWQHLGESDPYYSVLTDDRFAQGQIDEHLEEFRATGQRHAEMFFATLERNGVDPMSLGSCLEFGCGVGRVTRWLAPRFARVVGVDISGAHLALAGRYLAEERFDNVEWCHLSGVDRLDRLPTVDAVYSIIVLQHNPPPVIAVTIGALLDALNPGGVAYFQVPTYRKGYAFSVQSYLKAYRGTQAIEMHVLPQRHVFELIVQHGCELLEVIEDNWTGARDVEVSNTFVVRKLAGC